MPKKKKFSGYTNKGRRDVKQEILEELMNPDDNIAFLDAEFNAGMDSATGERICEIISVGLVICDGSYNGIKKYYSLVNTVTRKKIFPVISQMTGITSDMLIGQPEFGEVSGKIQEMVKKYSIKKIYTWGAADKHSLLGEKKLVRQLKAKDYQYASKWPYIDMCTDISEVISSKILGIKGNLTINMENLMFVCKMDKKQEHNALSDAYALYKCIKYLRQIYMEPAKSNEFMETKELINNYYQEKSTYNSFRRFRCTSKGADLYGTYSDKEMENTNNDMRIKALLDDIKYLKGEIPMEKEFDSIQAYFKNHRTLE